MKCVHIETDEAPSRGADGKRDLFGCDSGAVKVRLKRSVALFVRSTERKRFEYSGNSDYPMRHDPYGIVRLPR